MNTYFFAPQTEVQALFNTRYKFYRIGNKTILAEVMTFENPIFNPNGLEKRTPHPQAQKNFPDFEEFEKCEEDYERSKTIAINRARKRVFDLCANNAECDLFCTLTLDPKQISRTEWCDIVPKLSTWLDNRVRRNGLKYILVPEHHKDGEAIHFHGVMNASALKLADSGKLDKGKTVFNIVSWKYGFTTAKRIGETEQDRIAATKYICKYLSKENERIGGRYYFHGGELAEPFYRYANTNFSISEGFEMAFGSGVRAKIHSCI